MRYYIDTEFIERPGLLQLISIGMVCEDGRELYAVSNAFDACEASEWVHKNVLSKLGDAKRESPAKIRARILGFVDVGKPEFWGYFADYDWVVFCWLFGAMIDLPKGWPMYCLDLKQEMKQLGVDKSKLPPQPSETEAHNALADARWIRDAHEALLMKQWEKL